MQLKLGSAAGPYLVEGLIEEGGNAIIYLARHQELGSLHALKVIHLRRPGVRERLLREARLQGSLRHANIVPVTEVIRIGDAPALVMDYIAGPDLDGLLRHFKLSFAQVDELARGIIRGTLAAHAQGWIHRDLKPSNILMDLRDGELVPRISDFGLAKIRAEAEQLGLTETGATMGTPGYMAPEQIQDSRGVDGRADVFSLGALLYEALSGQRTFDGDTILNIWFQSAAGEFTPLDQLRPDLPDALVALIHGALETDPEQRVPNVETFLSAWEDASEEFLSGPDPQGGVWPQAFMDRLDELVTDRTRRIRMKNFGEASAEWASNATLQASPEFGSDVLHGANERAPGADTIAKGPPPAINLPEFYDLFVGRENELTALQEWVIAGARLITLTGPGGTGKTRLSLVFGQDQLRAFPGGVWFFDLTPVKSEAEFLRVVAETLDVPLEAEDPSRQLSWALRARGRVLLILDNMEQLVDHVASTVAKWVQQTPEAVFLVTSRVRLGVQAERLFLLNPLALDEGIRLFQDRAQQVNPGFELTAENLTVVAAIVEHLDCMSLAIELAAARAQLMSPEELLSRLDERFRLLRSNRRDQTPRQTTLRGAIDWSWDLLKPAEKAALAQCSVFRRGFTLEAAEAVLDLEAWETWPADAIQSLMEQSLLHRTEPRPGEFRFDMYESIREYAREKMSSEGGEAASEELGRRHGEFYAQLGSEEILDRAHWTGDPKLRHHLRQETDNLAAAMDYAGSRDRPDILGPSTLAWATAHHWIGSHEGTLDILEGVLPREGLDAAVTVRLHLASAMVQYAMGNPEGVVEAARAGLEIARGVGRPHLVGDCLFHRGLGLPREGSEGEKHRLYEEALGLFREAGDGLRAGEVLVALALVAQNRGDSERVNELCDAALREVEGRDSPRLEAMVLRRRAWILMTAGEMDRADEAILRALELARRTELRPLEVLCLETLGSLKKDQGCLDESVRAHEEGIQLAHEHGLRVALCALLGNLALVVQLQGDFKHAGELYREAIQLGKEMGLLAAAHMSTGNLGDLLLNQGRLDESAEHLTQAIAGLESCGDVASGAFQGSLGWVRAQQGALEEAREILSAGEARLRDTWNYELGRLLCRRAQLEHLAGEHPTSRRALDEARSLATLLQAGPDSDLGQAVTEAEEYCQDAS